jgi:hypothetical protein
MITGLTREAQIEDIGNHEAGAVAALRNLLATGANAIADPKRNGFYEVESDSAVYYIHVSPSTGKVLLLATWQNEAVTSGKAS